MQRAICALYIHVIYMCIFAKHSMYMCTYKEVHTADILHILNINLLDILYMCTSYMSVDITYSNSDSRYKQHTLDILFICKFNDLFVQCIFIQYTYVDKI